MATARFDCERHTPFRDSRKSAVQQLGRQKSRSSGYAVAVKHSQKYAVCQKKCIHSILEDNQWAHIAKCPCTHCTRAYTLVNTQLSVHSNYTQTVCKYVCIYIHVHLHFIYNEIIYDNNMLSWNLIVAPSSLLSLERMNHRSPKSGPPNWISPQWCSLLLPPAGLQDTSWNSGWWLQPQKYGCHGGKAKDVTDVTGTLSRPKWYLTSNFQYLESEHRFL